MPYPSYPLRIAILGTRGIPNRYGGFEQCAEYLAAGLAAKGHAVTVYNSSNHEYKGASWNNVNIVHCYDPEEKTGTAGQFIYDLNCIRHARRQGFDVALHLGYTSSSVWWRLWPRKAVNIVNMDGLEWARSKYSPRVQRFLKYAEKLAARHADVLIADSPGIQQHLQQRYGKASSYIPYGAEPWNNPDESALAAYGLSPGTYCMILARMEPENNIHTILEGFAGAASGQKMLVVGALKNSYAIKLQAQYAGNPAIHFAGSIYNQEVLHNLRHFAALYFHGHTVGGTNPSLLEAMACSATIMAHDNIFNRAVLGADGGYFSEAAGVTAICRSPLPASLTAAWSAANLEKIKHQYAWPGIVDAYEAAMYAAMKD